MYNTGSGWWADIFSNFRLRCNKFRMYWSLYKQKQLPLALYVKARDLDGWGGLCISTSANTLNEIVQGSIRIRALNHSLKIRHLLMFSIRMNKCSTKSNPQSPQLMFTRPNVNYYCKPTKM